MSVTDVPTVKCYRCSTLHPGGRVRVSAFDSMKSNKDPHPPLRGTFSRHREKALTLKSRRDVHRQSPRPRERERVAGGRVRASAFEIKQRPSSAASRHLLPSPGEGSDDEKPPRCTSSEPSPA